VIIDPAPIQHDDVLSHEPAVKGIYGRVGDTAKVCDSRATRQMQLDNKRLAKLGKKAEGGAGSCLARVLCGFDLKADVGGLEHLVADPGVHRHGG